MKRTRIVALVLALTMALGTSAMAAEYTVKSGDTLSKIAKSQLGDASLWREIFEANKDTIKDPNKIKVGQKLTIPGNEDAQPSTQPDEVPVETAPVDEQKPAAETKTVTGTAAGFVEDGEVETVTVTITVSDGKITAAEATSNRDSDVGHRALVLMPRQMVADNTVNVDAVSGATGTSNAVLAAARNAMAQVNSSGIDLHQWALDNGYVLASEYNLVPADAITSATAEGAPSGINFGYISFDEDGMKEYVAEMLGGPYTWGVHEPKYVVHKADDFVDGVDLTGLPMYRDMCALGTAGNNIPNTATIELVYDPYTSRFYGSSEAGTSKVNEFKLNPYVTVTYMVQMTDKFFNELGYDGFTAYADYGKLSSVMVYGKIHVITEDDFDGGELEEKALRALDVYMPTYYGTRWPFKTIDSRQEYAYDDATERAAKVAAAKTELAGVSAKYYIEPYRITASLYSVYPPFQISNTSAWSTYKTFSIKTEEATAANGYTEVWTGITEDQYCQAVIATNPGGASAGIRYWYESDKSWDFTWSEDGKELLKVEEHKDGDASVRYVTPYKYPWVRDSLIQVTAKLRKQWAAENPDVLKDKAGEEGNLTFTRNVLVKDVEVSGEVKHAGVAVTDDEVAALKLGTDYIKQQITMPNYIYYLVTTDYSMSAVQSQQNYTPYPQHNPSKATSSTEKAEEVLPEGVESDGEFHYTLLADGTYEIVKYAVTGGQSLTVDIPAEYKGVAVTSIGKEAFKDATNVGRINVPNSVTIFKEGAFYGVRSLKDMNVPASVKTIEKDCFNRTGWGNMNVDSFCIITFESMTPPAQELMMGNAEVGLDGTQVRIKAASAAAEATYKEAWAGLADLISKDWVNPS